MFGMNNTPTRISPDVAASSPVMMEATLDALRKDTARMAMLLDAPGATIAKDAPGLISEIAKVLQGLASVATDRTSAVAKALDPYVEQRATLQAAESAMWGICRSLEEGDTEKTRKQISLVVSLLEKVVPTGPGAPGESTKMANDEEKKDETEKNDAGGAAAEGAAAPAAPATSTVEFDSPGTAVAWGAAELARVGDTVDPVAKAERAAHLQKTAASIQKSIEGVPDMPSNLTVKMWTAYAPSAGNGVKVMPDITTPPDQKSSSTGLSQLATKTDLSKAFGDLAAHADGIAKSAAPAAVAKAAAPAHVWPASMTQNRPKKGKLPYHV